MIKARLGLWHAQKIKHGMIKAKLSKGDKVAMRETTGDPWR